MNSSQLVSVLMASYDVTLSASSRASIALEQRAGATVVAACDPSDAAAAHLASGDVVLSINGVRVVASERPPDLLDAESADEPLVMRVHRPAIAALAESAAASAQADVNSDAPLLGGSFGGYGVTPANFSMPCNVLRLPDGDVLVADAGGCRLQVCSANGELRRVLRCGRGHELNYPAGLCLAADGTSVYVADRGNCRVQLLRLSDGQSLASSGDGAVEAAGEELLNYPWGVALHNGRVYVTDMRGRLVALDALTLRPLACWQPIGLHAGSTPSNACRQPAVPRPPHESSISLEHSQSQSQSQSHESSISNESSISHEQQQQQQRRQQQQQQQQQQQEEEEQWAQQDDSRAASDGEDPLGTPTALASPHAMVAAGDELYIAEYDAHCVTVLTMALTSPHAGIEDASLPAYGLLWDGSGRGCRCIGRRGTAPGEFVNPVGVAVHERTLFVSEFTGRRLQALTLGGVPLYLIAAPSGARLLGLCVGPERIHAGDFDSDQVHWWRRPDASAVHASVAVAPLRPTQRSQARRSSFEEDDFKMV